MDRNAPKVSVVILNWNGKADTAECVESLRGIKYPNYEVLLVDNHSTDGSPAYFKERFPDLKLIVNEANLGFAEGNNVGIRQALQDGAEYVLLLNNDTVVEPGFMDGMVSVAESDPRIGIVGPMIRLYSDPSRVWAVGGTISLFTGIAANNGEGEEKGRFKGIRAVDYVTGCALMIKSNVVKEIGLLDTDYFLYMEDADWNLKARRRGYLSAIDCDVSILHKAGASTRKIKDSHYYYMARNIPLFVKKNGKPYHKAIFFPLFTAHYMIVLLYNWATGRGSRSKYVLMGIGDLVHKKYGRPDLAGRA